MNSNPKKQRKILKILLTRNPNCSMHGIFVFFISGYITFQVFLSILGSYILYYYLSYFSLERLQKLTRRSRVVGLTLFILPVGILILSKIFLNKISWEALGSYSVIAWRTPFIIFLLPILFLPLPILFGFSLGRSLWNLKIFQKTPKLRFVFLPLIIWWGMFLYELFFLVFADPSFANKTMARIVGIIGGTSSLLIVIFNLISWEICKRFCSNLIRFIIFLFVVSLLLIVASIWMFDFFITTF